MDWLIVIAGLINSLYLLPMTKDRNNNILLWLFFSIFSFLIVPFIVILYCINANHYDFNILQYITMGVFGLLYGSGLIMLIIAIGGIGIGLPYAFSILFNTLSGSLFSAVIFNKITQINITVWIGYSLFLLAVITLSLALINRDGLSKVTMRYLGLTILGALLCSTQGACLSYFSNVLKFHNSSLLSQYIPWSVIFIFSSFIIISFFYLQKNKLISLSGIQKLYRTLIMVFFYWASILLYNTVNFHDPSFSEERNWAVFALSMLIGGNILSYSKREWMRVTLKCHLYNFMGILISLASCFLIIKNNIF